MDNSEIIKAAIAAEAAAQAAVNLQKNIESNKPNLKVGCRYLLQDDFDGVRRVYPWHSITAKRADMQGFIHTENGDVFEPRDDKRLTERPELDRIITGHATTAIT